MLISGEDGCAIIYDGINQSGESENIPEGEFEANRLVEQPVMVLGDRSESVYVYPVRAQVFVFWTFFGHDDRPFLT